MNPIRIGLAGGGCGVQPLRLADAPPKTTEASRDSSSIATGIWARFALEAEIPDTAIVQMGGWGSVHMLRRYHGKLTRTELKRYPTTLAKYIQRMNNGVGRSVV